MKTTVLDLLSVVGKLSLSGENGFSEVAWMMSSNAYEVWPAALRRDLEGLGHAKCFFERSEIHVLAPGLCLLPRGTNNAACAVLIGARTEISLTAMESACVRRGLKFERTTLDKGLPDRISVSGQYRAMKETAIECQIDIGDDCVTPDAWRVLHNVASLQTRFKVQPVSGVQTITSGTKGLQIYDHITGRFTPWEQISNYNADVALIRKTTYEHRLARKMNSHEWVLQLAPVKGDPRWAMWMVRNSVVSGRLLPKPIDWTLRVPKSCPLPIELHQVGCLCSGRLPTITADSIEYSDVPPVIQHQIEQKLTFNTAA